MDFWAKGCDRMLTANQMIYLLQGTLWTLALSVCGACGGAVLGLLIALMRVSKRRLWRSLASTYVKLVQGVPLPVMMFLAYFGLALIGRNIPAFVAAAVSMTVFAAAYLGEIWRGCIEAVPRAQWEAAESLGLKRFAVILTIILPQAVRISIPPTVGFMVQIIKNTSYAVVIGFVELTQSGRIINNAVFEPFLIFSIIGAIYFALCYPISRLSQRLEARLKSRGA
jgi:polar amino acid transport system permease protein